MIIVIELRCQINYANILLSETKLGVARIYTHSSFNNNKKCWKGSYYAVSSIKTATKTALELMIESWFSISNAVRFYNKLLLIFFTIYVKMISAYWADSTGVIPHFYGKRCEMVEPTVNRLSYIERERRRPTFSHFLGITSRITNCHRQRLPLSIG